MSADPFEGNRTEGGEFTKGHKGGPGRPKQSDLFAKSLRKAGEEQPTTLHYKLAARGLGIEPEEVPTFTTIRELNCWVVQLASISGDTKTQAALLDREAPKPTRVAADPSAKGTRAPAGALGSDPLAQRYIDLLNPEDES